MVKKIRNVLFGVLSFILSLVLFALSYCIVLESTIFNSDFVLENMNSSNYFSDKKDEIVQSLTDLGYASGLNEEFFKDVVDEVTLHENTQEYIENFYAANGTDIDTKAFQRNFSEALDDYIKTNGITVSDESSREYLTKRAVSIYKNSLEIPLFSTLSAYFLKIKRFMPLVLVGLIVLGAVIVLVFFLTAPWKHRAVKYCYYATAGACLSVGVIPAIIMLTNSIGKINLVSRALYNAFVQCGNSIMIALLVCSLVMLVISILLVFQHNIMKKRITDD
jgi:hypothetical protein